MSMPTTLNNLKRLSKRGILVQSTATRRTLSMLLHRDEGTQLLPSLIPKKDPTLSSWLEGCRTGSKKRRSPES